MATEAMAGALDFAVRLVAVGLAITGAELIADRGAFNAGGPFGPQVLAALRGGKPPRMLLGSRGVAFVAATQVFAAAVLVAFGPFLVVGRCALVALVITTTLFRRRRVIGGDGAEQMSDIVIVSALLAVLPFPGEGRITLAVIFITAQSVLSYFTSGVAKLVSTMWRDGRAMPAILSTYNHGLAPVSRIMQSRPAVGFVLGWTVIVFEVLFPLVLIAPPSVAVAALSVGLMFHLGCAVLMGLNSFVWPFPATYACVLAIRASLVG